MSLSSSVPMPHVCRVPAWSETITSHLHRQQDGRSELKAPNRTENHAAKALVLVSNAVGLLFSFALLFYPMHTELHEARGFGKSMVLRAPEQSADMD